MIDDAEVRAAIEAIPSTLSPREALKALASDLVRRFNLELERIRHDFANPVVTIRAPGEDDAQLRERIKRNSVVYPKSEVKLKEIIPVGEVRTWHCGDRACPTRQLATPAERPRCYTCGKPMDVVP